MTFVELRITVAWALESPQNEFVWGSYVQNTSRLSWKSTMRFLFYSVRTCVAVFETVRVVLGFWFLHEICRGSSRGHLNRPNMSLYEGVISKILVGCHENRQWGFCFVISEPVLLFLRQLESFWGSSVCMRFVYLRVLVAWALESLQKEFVWESYVQNSEIPTGCHENQ